jgi:hypothetical protein
MIRGSVIANTGIIADRIPAYCGIYYNDYKDVLVHLCDDQSHHIATYDLVEVSEYGIELYKNVGDALETDDYLHRLVIDGVDLV